MATRGIHLQYRFENSAGDAPTSQQGAQVQNPLFDALLAVREHGSIQHAARATGVSYRHLWGALKQWEGVLGQPLVSWSQGQPARLTPFADRLLWAETRARARLTPHIEALRAELSRVLTDALDGTQQVLAVFASHDLALPLLREHAAAQGLHIELRFAGSLDALRALDAGRCVVAGFHVPVLQAGGPAQVSQLFAAQLKPLLKPGRHKLIGSARRLQGLMVARGNPLQSARAGRGGERRVRVLCTGRPGRARGCCWSTCASRRAWPLPNCLATACPHEDSHLAVAAAVASGAGDAGLGIAAAATPVRAGLRAPDRGGLLPRMPARRHWSSRPCDCCGRCCKGRPGETRWLHCRGTRRRTAARCCR
jgi:putative molybdopterin biosynthesis protein